MERLHKNTRHFMQ